MIYKYVHAQTAREALASLPKIGEKWPEFEDHSVAVAWYETSMAPQSFICWLLRRPPLWHVNVGFRPQSDIDRAVEIGKHIDAIRTHFATMKHHERLEVASRLMEGFRVDRDGMPDAPNPSLDRCTNQSH